MHWTEAPVPFASFDLMPNEEDDEKPNARELEFGLHCLQASSPISIAREMDKALDTFFT
ncbi:hypothetical protein [Soonwooa sp.]|uniref:hypothetical protein n=1 Tax=Soonwooa sp. TaxID=1938592 RepID=UPI0026101C27|nr:hypothetical protein [Soonwooa sp.]